MTIYISEVCCFLILPPGRSFVVQLMRSPRTSLVGVFLSQQPRSLILSLFLSMALWYNAGVRFEIMYRGLYLVRLLRSLASPNRANFYARKDGGNGEGRRDLLTCSRRRQPRDKVGGVGEGGQGRTRALGRVWYKRRDQDYRMARNCGRRRSRDRWRRRQATDLD